MSTEIKTEPQPCNRTEAQLEVKPGAKLQVYADGSYRDCVILHKSGYQGRSGHVFWEYRYDPLPKKDPNTGILPSTGGDAAALHFRTRR